MLSGTPDSPDPVSLQGQTTLWFQGGEVGDTWTYTSTGADATAISESHLAPNIVTGLSSIVVGGNSGGGSCIDGGNRKRSKHCPHLHFL